MRKYKVYVKDTWEKRYVAYDGEKTYNKKGAEKRADQARAFAKKNKQWKGMKVEVRPVAKQRSRNDWRPPMFR